MKIRMLRGVVFEGSVFLEGSEQEVEFVLAQGLIDDGAAEIFAEAAGGDTPVGKTTVAAGKKVVRKKKIEPDQ